MRIDQFWSECIKLSSLQHPPIVGFVVQTDFQILLYNPFWNGLIPGFKINHQ